MKREEAIKQLKDLIEDRKAFCVGDYDKVFDEDIEALEYAIKELENVSKYIKLKEMLHEAIELWGFDDIVTKMLSQRLDKEVNKRQIEIYEEYKKGA